MAGTKDICRREYTLKGVRKVLNAKVSLLHEFGGYDNTASVSFMEGDLNQHMLDVYERYRLEFDLRKIGIGVLSDRLVDCEYVAENEHEEYVNEYCEMIGNTLHAIPTLQEKYGQMFTFPINNLIDFLIMEMDIITKVVCLKEQKWAMKRSGKKYSN